MSVELAKVVAGTIVQRARFAIPQLRADSWRVVVIVHHDEASQDDIEAMRFATAAEALAHVHARFATHFLAFSPAELAGAEVAWDVSAYEDTSMEYLDLATLVATEVEEALGEEIAVWETADLRRRGELITWGMLDEETDQFTPQYTEYPGQGGTPTRVIYADGRVLYIDDEGQLVDEHGKPVEEGTGEQPLGDRP